MKRDTLRRFIRELVMATLPLGVAACSGSPTIGNNNNCPNYFVPNADYDAGCQTVCTTGRTACAPVDGGVECYDICGTGRRPEGLAAVPAARGSALGRWLAEVAHLEAASVDAFRRLADELRSFGAPPSLITRALEAARDEIRHARVTGRLARAAGSQPERPQVAPPVARPLEALAVENAREGCVRETFGALIATWQAEAAGDRRLAEAMRAIAADETRHAELAWDVHRWALGRLDRDARARVVDEMRVAADELCAAAAAEPTVELVAQAGLPQSEIARRLAEETRRALWS